MRQDHRDSAAPALAAHPGTAVQQLRAVAEDPDKILFRRAMALTRNPADAHDLTQRTLERGLRCLGQFQPGTNIRVWLLRILVNIFLDDCRRRTRGPRVEPFDEASHALAPVEEPEHEPVWAAITPEQVQAALSGITPLFREIYQLRVRDGLSYQEISERMQIPLGTVSTRLARAREKLQVALAATVDPVDAAPEERR
jgi:RNA polymerase sigma-70 factor (ECF subfamily)